MKKKTTTKAALKKTAAPAAKAPGRASKSDWRLATLGQIRTLIEEADPEAIEEAKWKKVSRPAGVPTWSHDGIICTGESYKDKVKLTFAQGAALDDPAHLFNAGLDGGTRRAIDISEGQKINDKAFKTLIRAAAALNAARQKKPAQNKPAKKAKKG